MRSLIFLVLLSLGAWAQTDWVALGDDIYVSPQSVRGSSSGYMTFTIRVDGVMDEVQVNVRQSSYSVRVYKPRTSYADQSSVATTFTAPHPIPPGSAIEAGALYAQKWLIVKGR